MANNNFFQYTKAMNIEDGGGTPSNSIVVKIRCVDIYGQKSGYLQGTFTNPAPSTPDGFTSFQFMNGIKFTWNAAPENDFAYWSYRTQVESEGWSNWVHTLTPEVYVFLDDTQSETYNYTGATIYIEVVSYDTFGNGSGTGSDNDTTGSLIIPTTSINDFSQISSGFPDIIVLRDFVWASNSPGAGSIAWTSGSLWYGGIEYSISSGNASTRYVYWDPNGTTTIFVATDNDSTIPVGAFPIAANDGGTYQEIWANAKANQVIGSSWIVNAAIITAKIDDLAVTTAKIASLAVTNAQINDLSASKINAGSMNASYITAGTLTATQINGSSFGTLTISSGAIVIQTSNGLDIGGSGNIRVQAGNDINMVGNDSNPGNINFVGTSYTTNFGGTTDGSEFAIEPATDAVVTLRIGYNGFMHYNRFYQIHFGASNEIQLYSEPSAGGNQYAVYRLVTPGSTYNHYHEFQVSYSGSIYSTIYYSAGTGGHYFGPGPYNKVIDLARASYAFAQAYADTWNDVADVPILDEHDDLNIIYNMKSSGIRDEITGFLLLNDSTLPSWYVARYMKDSEERIPLPNDFDGEEYNLLFAKYKRENGLNTDYKKILRQEIDSYFDYAPYGHWHWTKPGDRIKVFKKGSAAYTADGKPYISSKTHRGLHDGALRQLVDEQQQIHDVLEYLQIQVNKLKKNLN